MYNLISCQPVSIVGQSIQVDKTHEQTHSGIIEIKYNAVNIDSRQRISNKLI